MKLTKDLNNNDIEINEEILIKIDWQKLLQGHPPNCKEHPVL